MKGIELPINTLVVIAVVLLVLLGVVALWMGGWVGGSQSVSIEAAKASGCSVLMRDFEGCGSVNPTSIIFDPANACCYGIILFDVNQNGVLREAAGDNLQILCNRYYDTITAADCRKICGCGS